MRRLGDLAQGETPEGRETGRFAAFISYPLRHHTGAPGRIRTCDARFRKPTLYPLSYGSKIIFELVFNTKSLLSFAGRKRLIPLPSREPPSRQSHFEAR